MTSSRPVEPSLGSTTTSLRHGVVGSRLALYWVLIFCNAFQGFFWLL